jgi:Na+/phosphate symporter
LTSVFDWVFDPITIFLLSFLPRWGVFILGFIVMMGSFSLIDRSLPEIKLEDTGFSGMARILYRPLFTFLLGAAVTTITMSVSLSVSILVPLSMRGYVRRENIIPYVMGANITTFIDTLIAAILLGNPAAFTVVLLEMLSISLVSLVVIGIFYMQYERTILKIEESLLSRRSLLMLYMFGIVGIPILLMLI